MNIIEKIQREIFYDVADTDKQSDRLLEIYNNSNNQEEIDKILICLCGYGMLLLEQI